MTDFRISVRTFGQTKLHTDAVSGFGHTCHADAERPRQFFVGLFEQNQHTKQFLATCHRRTGFTKMQQRRRIDGQKGVTEILFDLSVFLQGSQGNKIFNASRIDMEGMTDFRNQSVRVLDRWKRPGMITNVPRVGNTENNHNSSRFVEDGSYLRLKTVTLSYNFPKKWLNKIHLSRLQAYVTGQNLFTLTKYKGYDPEVNAFGGDSVAQGVDYGTYPQSRAVIFGLNVEF